jgi:uncharacterized PurR-regulated membrane protein YhhQ (DUF165 family)
MNISLEQLIVGANWPAELPSLLLLVLCFAALSFLGKRYGLPGLYVYGAIATCLANLQVLHITRYTLCHVPFPLGTIPITTVSFANILITAAHGKHAARRAVVLQLLAYAFFSLHMVVSLMHTPATAAVSGWGGEDAVAGQSYLQYALLNYQAMVRIFSPALRLFVAGIVAFFIAQYVNIFVSGKFLNSGRAGLARLAPGFSTFFAGLVDSIIFNLLAFYLLAEVKPTLVTLFTGYVLETMVIRFIVVLAYEIWTKFVKTECARVA